MSNKFFYVHNGLTVGNGGTIIDGTTGTIYTPGSVVISSSTNATSTNSGALIVSGGAGIGQNLYVGGAIYSSATNLVLTTATVGGYAVTAITGGSGISVTGTVGQITVASTDTFQTVTSRGSSTNQIITITNVTSSTTSTNGALVVSGGVGIGAGLNVVGNTNIYGNLAVSGNITGSAVVVTVNQVSATSGVFYGDATGNGALYAGVQNYTPFAQTMFQATGNYNGYMEINVQNVNTGTQASTDIVASADNVTTSSAYIDMGITGSKWDGSQPLSLGTALGPNDGYIMVGTNAVAGLGDLVLGTTTTGTQMRFVVAATGTVTTASVAMYVNPVSTPTNSTNSGVLQVVGGVGVAGGLFVGGAITATSITLTSSETDQGTLAVQSTATSNATNTGALTVAGGAGIGGALNVGGSILSSGFQVLTSATVANYIAAGTDTQVVVNLGTGVVTVNNTATLQSVTARGATTPSALSITNSSNGTSTSSGQALLVTGGAGFGGNIAVGGTAYIAGDLYVDGTQFIVNKNNISSGDAVLFLNTSAASASLAANSGLAIGTTSSPYITWYYDGSSVNGAANWVSSGGITVNTTGTFKSSGASSTGVAGNALQVINGGIGVAGNSYIGGNLTVNGTINATINGSISTATSLSGGIAGDIPIQTATGQTSFIVAGSAGNILIMQTGSTATWQSTSTLVVGAAQTVGLTPNASANSSYYVGIFSSSTGVLSPNTAYGLYYNPSTNTLYSGTFNGSHVGSGAGLTNIPNSALTNNTITVSAGNTAIGVSGSPVALGGTVVVSNLGVTQFLGGTTGLTATNQTGTVILSGTLGIANGGTAATAIGPAGAVAISNGTSYQFAATGTTGYILTQGVNTVTWTAVTGVTAGFATTATNILGGLQGYIPIQSAAGITSYITSGTTGQVLAWNGSTATWTALSSLTAGQATTATDLAGGTVGQIPYQTAAGLTGFTGPGTAGQILESNGAAAPTYVSQSALSVGTATNLSGGGAGYLVYQQQAGLTGYVNPLTYGYILQSGGTGNPFFAAQNTLAVGTATNLAGGALGSIPYQNAAGQTSFIPIGANGTLLISNGTTATWATSGSLVAGNASTATNLYGGVSGQIPIQIGAGATSFIASGTVGTVLVMGTNTATWQNSLTLTSNTTASSTNTGALQVVGGIGVGGTVYAGGSVVANGGFVIGSGAAISQNDNGQTVNNTITTIDTFPLAVYRTAKYVISVSNTVTSQYQSSEILVIHDGVTPSLQDTSVFTGAAPMMTFSVTTATGNVLLQGLGVANTNTVKIQRIYISV